MRTKKKTLEYLKENLPPCLPGDYIYWINDMGKIKVDKQGIKSIELDAEGNWWINDYDGARDIVNSNEYSCISPSALAKVRNNITVSYAIFTKNENGEYSIKDENYSLVKVGSFTGEAMMLREDYIDTIKRIECIKEDDVIAFHSSDSEQNYQVSADKYRTSVDVVPLTKCARTATNLWRFK